MKGRYTPGVTFGSFAPRSPAYLLIGSVALMFYIEAAWTSYVIMEGGVARSPVSTRPREPDFEVIEKNGAHFMRGFEHYRRDRNKKSINMWKLLYYQPGLCMDHILMMTREIIPFIQKLNCRFDLTIY